MSQQKSIFATLAGLSVGNLLSHKPIAERRVLVVNERRWRPIVDIYDLGPDLNVRGRHDGHVAALSFSDDARLSMVDGIGEVELAVALAKATREPSSTDEHQSHEF